MENPGLTPLQGPALTAVLHSPCETCPRKIVQPALKICFRLCPQKVPHREFEFLLLLLQSRACRTVPRGAAELGTAASKEWKGEGRDQS